MILVDTSVLIDFLKGNHNSAATSFKRILEQGVLFGINAFIYQELLQGAKDESEFERLGRYLRTQKFYHLNDPIESFNQAAKIYSLCRRKGITIRSTIDCLIAQTAMENNLLLLHNDSDFDAIAQVVQLQCLEHVV